MKLIFENGRIIFRLELVIGSNIIFLIQKLILYFSYYLFKFFPALRKVFFRKIEEKINKDKPVFIIGVSEIANVLNFLSLVLPNSISVCFYKNKFYLNNVYDIYPKNDKRIYKGLYIFFISPWVLGYLVNVGDIFFYNWLNGFIFNFYYLKKLNMKPLLFELNFLRKNGKKTIWYFCGDDIRSIKLTKEYFNKLNLDTFANYYPEYYHTQEYDEQKKLFANVISNNVDIVFNHKNDQISYLTCKQYMAFYYYPISKFNLNQEKLNNFERITILHAPSSFIFKGTFLVRAAIKKLQMEGYNFEYIEIFNRSNEEVLELLKKAHIVLNQFYSLAPGTFGLEALANYCVVLQSADYKEYISLYLEDAPNLIDHKDLNINEEDYENIPWVVTKYYDIYFKLKFLLDNKHLLKKIAENGYNFAYKYFSDEFAKKYLKIILNKNGIKFE